MLLFDYDLVFPDGYVKQMQKSVVITGTNAAPRIDSNSSMLQGNVEEFEDSYNSSGSHITVGNIVFSDVDASDTHHVDVSANGANYLGNLTTEIITNDDGSTVVNWIFDVEDGSLDFLTDGQKLVQNYTVDIVDDKGAKATQTISINLTGTNDAPVATPLQATTNEDAAPSTIDLSAEVSDPDGDSFSIGNIVQTKGWSVTFYQDGNNIVVDPTTLQFLNTGETENVEFTYDITDSNGKKSTNTLALDVEGISGDVVAPITPTNQFTNSNQSLWQSGPSVVTQNNSDNRWTIIDMEGTANLYDYWFGNTRFQAGVDYSMQVGYGLRIEYSENNHVSSTIPFDLASNITYEESTDSIYVFSPLGPTVYNPTLNAHMEYKPKISLYTFANFEMSDFYKAYKYGNVTYTDAKGNIVKQAYEPIEEIANVTNTTYTTNGPMEIPMVTLDSIGLPKLPIPGTSSLIGVSTGEPVADLPMTTNPLTYNTSDPDIIGTLLAEGKSNDFARIWFDVDELLALIANKAAGNHSGIVFNPFNIRASFQEIITKIIGPNNPSTAKVLDKMPGLLKDLKIELQFLDLDVFVGVNFIEELQLALNSTSATLLMENGDRLPYTYGDTMQIDNASYYDENGDGNVDVHMLLGLDADMTHNQDFGIDLGYQLDFLKFSVAGVNVIGPVQSYTGQTNIAAIDMNDATFDFVYPEIVGVSEQVDISVA
ncbi:hypothetical protein D5085_17490 [Ectothiorhodospiraceae bacterium BW-2]|nr:hypothetical protein D5085_17490 [Ectothiorhodospiraceae bacterium BW-2]